ncbi:MAG: ArgE/DapE family deacylase [Armatimonadetes bacterium]|nr:ArgE/DapE family deacylase [Armatimonadota bacterium]
MTSGVDEVVDLTAALVRIPSENPTGTEEACARFVADWLGRLDVEVMVEEVAPGRPNVIGRLRGRGGAPPLAYVAHMDTVPAGEGWTVDPFGGAVKDGRMYGRGTTDMKGGLAAAMVAFKAALAAHPRAARDFLLCATMDEEGPHMMGATALAQREYLPVDALVLAPEPSALQLIVAHKGVMWYKVAARGRAAHAGAPQVGADAIHGMAEFVARVKRRFDGLPGGHPLLGGSTVTIGRVAGGIKTNVVPEFCTAEVDCRLAPPVGVPDVEALLQEAAREAAQAVPGVTFAVEQFSAYRPAVEAAAGSPLGTALAEAHREVTGTRVERTGISGYTDAAILAVIQHNPHCFVYGPGFFQQAHTVDEFVPVEHLRTAAHVLTRAAEMLLA